MKRLFAMIIVLVMAVSMTTLACAAEAPTAVNDVATEQSISPRIDWDGKL
jgi:lipoprotein